jgi:hypothetical protein
MAGLGWLTVKKIACEKEARKTGAKKKAARLPELPLA